jgi:hypothetical protein
VRLFCFCHFWLTPALPLSLLPFPLPNTNHTHHHQQAAKAGVVRRQQAAERAARRREAERQRLAAAEDDAADDEDDAASDTSMADADDEDEAQAQVQPVPAVCCRATGPAAVDNPDTPPVAAGGATVAAAALEAAARSAPVAAAAAPPVRAAAAAAAAAPMTAAPAPAPEAAAVAEALASADVIVPRARLLKVPNLNEPSVPYVVNYVPGRGISFAWPFVVSATQLGRFEPEFGAVIDYGAYRDLRRGSVPIIAPRVGLLPAVGTTFVGAANLMGMMDRDRGVALARNGNLFRGGAKRIPSLLSLGLGSTFTTCLVNSHPARSEAEAESMVQRSGYAAEDTADGSVTLTVYIDPSRHLSIAENPLAYTCGIKDAPAQEVLCVAVAAERAAAAKKAEAEKKAEKKAKKKAERAAASAAADGGGSSSGSSNISISGSDNGDDGSDDSDDGDGQAAPQLQPVAAPEPPEFELVHPSKKTTRYALNLDGTVILSYEPEPWLVERVRPSKTEVLELRFYLSYEVLKMATQEPGLFASCTMASLAQFLDEHRIVGRGFAERLEVAFRHDRPASPGERGF